MANPSLHLFLGLFYPHKIKPQGNAALAIVGHATTKLVI